MMWIDDLREELASRQANEDHSGDEAHQREAVAADEAVARADAVVRTLLDQMNQALLAGRGAVWDAPASWGVHLWELWWEPTRESGPYLVVTLLRDSRGTPYLKMAGRRLVLEDVRLERRLQRALRAAFLEPRVYTPRRLAPASTQDRRAALDSGRAEGRLISQTAGRQRPAQGAADWVPRTEGRPGAGGAGGATMPERRGMMERAIVYTTPT